ncbi:divalent cation transporter [Alicyclobacillus hesperidum subsp. aegles]|uniref:ZIP family metal transporter n=1 Tax=Alicyclobacillus hesperidum TaxID=89784 RepID=UPI00222AD943|nr:ZIP family metal transporter [Alicyclobacillus hesperidum]GLG00181.1 divalent cation transporter [Alicyclobacillus hesperidum subsp. aegles]
MTSVWLALFLSALAAMADTVGGALTVVRQFEGRTLASFTSIGAGFLLGATLLDRLPDTLHTMPKLGVTYMLIGYLLVLTLEIIRHSRNHENTHSHATGHAHTAAMQGGTIALVSMMVHTFMDGVVIAGALAANRAEGILMFVAITLHKVPEGLTISAISLNSSNSRRRAFLWAFLLTCSTIVGAITAVVLGSVGGPSVNIIMALATGTFLFISTSDLVPFVRAQEQPRNMLLLLFGCGVFYLSLTLLQSIGLS